MSKQIHYVEGYKYRLARDFSISTPIKPPHFIYTEQLRLDVDGELYIREGYAWDGPSGPTADTSDSMRGALVHDAFYELMSKKLLSLEFREAVDKFFYKLLREDGMWLWRASAWYMAVRVAGAPAAESEDEVLTAP